MSKRRFPDMYFKTNVWFLRAVFLNLFIHAAMNFIFLKLLMIFFDITLYLSFIFIPFFHNYFMNGRILCVYRVYSGQHTSKQWRRKTKFYPKTRINTTKKYDIFFVYLKTLYALLDTLRRFWWSLEFFIRTNHLPNKIHETHVAHNHLCAPITFTY